MVCVLLFIVSLPTMAHVNFSIVSCLNAVNNCSDLSRYFL